MQGDVGFIGLGTMGGGMARNLLKRGVPLWVYDLRPEAVVALAGAGAQAASNISEVGMRCGRIFLSLPDTEAVAAVLEGLEPAPGQILIDCGTTHPDFTRQTAAALRERGIAFLDAPVSGMRDRAEAGTLAVMAGGDEEAFRKVQPLLRMIGERVTYVGGPGNGQLTKMINNVLFNISCAAMAEALPMAVRLGLDAEQVCAAVSAGSGQSFGFDFFSRLALRRDFTPGYPMAAAYKDMAVLAEMADRHGIPAPVASAARQTYERALRMGLGGENKGAMIKVWEEALGLEVKQKEAR